MNKLYLHMGFHKTATSSFQQTCKANVDALYDMDYLYPIFNSEHINHKDIANHSIPIRSLLMEDPKRFHVNIRHNVKDVAALNKDYWLTLENTLNKGKKENKNVILSGEGISLHSTADLQVLVNFIEKFGFEIVPVVIVRSPYEYHCSFVQQVIKDGSFESHLLKKDPQQENIITSFASQIEKIKTIEQTFENINYFPFKKTCEHENGPVGFLLDYLGVDLKKIDYINYNEGVSNTHARSQLVLNKKGSAIINGVKNDDWKSICNRGKKFFKSKFYLTEDEYSDIKGQLMYENEYFESVLGPEFKDRKLNFSDSNNVYVELSEFLANDESQLKDDDADYLREAAIKLEKTDIELSEKLMQLAHTARPNGPFINRKLKEYAVKMKNKK